MLRAFRTAIVRGQQCPKPCRPVPCPIVDMYHEGPSPLPLAQQKADSARDCPQNNRACPISANYSDDAYQPEYQPCSLGNSCPMLIWNGN